MMKKLPVQNIHVQHYILTPNDFLYMTTILLNCLYDGRNRSDTYLLKIHYIVVIKKPYVSYNASGTKNNLTYTFYTTEAIAWISVKSKSFDLTQTSSNW